MAEQPDISNTPSLNRTDSELNAAAPPFEFRPSAPAQQPSAPAAPVRSYASVVGRDSSARSQGSSQSSTTRNRAPTRSSTSSRSPAGSRPASAAPRRNPSSSSLNFNFNPNALPFVNRSSSSPETPPANPNAAPFFPRSSSPAEVIEEEQETGDLTAKDAIADNQNHQNASSTADLASTKAEESLRNGFHDHKKETNGVQKPNKPAPIADDASEPCDAGDPPSSPTDPQEQPAEAAPPSEQPAEGNVPPEKPEAVAPPLEKPAEAVSPPEQPAASTTTTDSSDAAASQDSSFDLPHTSPLAHSAEQMRKTAPADDTTARTDPTSPAEAAPLSPRPHVSEAWAADGTATENDTVATRTWPPSVEVNGTASPPAGAGDDSDLRPADGALSVESGLHAAMGDSTGALLVGNVSSGVTPRALSHSMQQHERSVSRLRTAVHHEIVRALQRLTLMPISTAVPQQANGVCSGSSGNAAAASGEVSLAGGVTSASGALRVDHSVGAPHAGRMEQAACMDHFVARAHADAITAHTHSAFQKLDDRTAEPEAVACNYCRAVMVDVLAVAASWRAWIAPHCTSPMAADSLAAEHGRCIDVLTAAMPSVPGLSDWYAGVCEREDDPFRDEEDAEAGGGRGAWVPVAEGVVSASTDVQGLPGVQLKCVGAVPWVAKAAAPANFEAQVRTAAMRMLRSAMGSGEGLVVVAREFRAESGREARASSGTAARSGIAGSGYAGATFESRGSRALGSAVGDDEDGDVDAGEDTDDGDAEEREEEAEVVGEDGDADDSAPRGRLSWGTSQELGVLHSGTAGAPAVRRSYAARTRSGGAGARRPRPRQPRACLSPTAVPPANISFATLVSPEATPRGRRPWFRSGDALGVGKQQTLGMLEPQHPKLRPIVVQEPGVALGCALPNEAQQHLTLTQQDGSEPLWRAGVHHAEVAQRGLQMLTILDSRVAYVHCIIGPASAMACLSGAPESPPPAATAAVPVDASANGISTDSSGPIATAPSSSRGDTGAGDAPDAPATFVLARALTGMYINSQRIEHGVRAMLREGDNLTIVPQSPSGPALSYTFHAGDPTARLIPPHISVAASLPPLHSIPLCQICGGLPRACLELQPCGHTFCAACLSHKFAYLLSTASHLACPHGCPHPESINQCPEIDALVASLPEYLQRLSRVVDWRSGRQESENGNAALTAFGSPRSPNWAGRSPGSRSCVMGCAGESCAGDGVGTAALSTFERFVESLGPDAWQHTPRAAVADARPAATRHGTFAVAVSGESATSTAEGLGSGADVDTTPPFETTTAPVSFIPEHPGRPAAISELVPLTRDMLPLSMQELQAQQSDVSANVVKSAAECGCEMKELRIVIRHLYVLMHAAMMSSLWKEELNRAGTVEDSAAAARAVVQAAQAGRTGPRELGGELGQQLLCAAATMICSLVLTQQPGMEEVCQGNQWRAARANVVEVLVEALDVWPDNHTVAHSCLQCLVALCKDNAMMKANVTVAALKPAIRVLQNGGARFAIAERGFTLLAVLQAGGDHLNDGVRRLLSEAGLQDAAIKALRTHAGGDERALTAVCFAIAMILRGGEKWRESVKWAAARNALLGSIMKAERVYRFRCRAMRVPPDDALSALLAFLVLYLEPVQKAIKVRRKAMRAWALFGVGVVAFATLLTGLRRQAQRQRVA